MKNLIFFAISFYLLLIAGCATANPAIYIEKSLSDVKNKKYNFNKESYHPESGLVPGNGRNGIDAYGSSDAGYYWFNFCTDVYIRNENGKVILQDDESNQIEVSGSQINNANSNIFKLYNISQNSSFDPNKKYKVYYRLRSVDSYLSGSSNVIIYIDAIDGLLTYKESLELDYQKKKNTEKTARQNEIAEMNLAYEEALKSAGTAKIIDYINKYRQDGNFNEDSYAEIARRITKNKSVEFNRLYTAPNPYAFNTEAVYYCGGLSVQKFQKGKIIAYINSFIRDDGNLIVIGSVPDISKIGNYISHAYLKYTGITTVAFNNGGMRELPTFTMVFNF